MSDDRDVDLEDFTKVYLLIGPATRYPSGCRGWDDLPARVRRQIDAFKEPRAVVAAWRARAAELRTFAVERNIKPAWPGPSHYAEMVAAADDVARARKPRGR